MKKKIKIGLIVLLVILAIGVIVISGYALNKMVTQEEKTPILPIQEEGSMVAGKHYDSEYIVDYSVSEVIENAKRENYSIRYGSMYGGPYEYFNWEKNASHKLGVAKEDYISIRISDKNYWITIGPADVNNPSNRNIRVKFVPLKNLTLMDAKVVVIQELNKLNISIKGEISWDLNKGYQPPELEAGF